MASSRTSNIDLNDVIKKEARGSGDEDLGEVQETGQDYVLVQRGMINKEKFYIPKDMVESYDGSVLRFKISEDDSKNRFLRDSTPPPSTSSSRASKETSVGQTEETTVPL